MSDRLLIRTEVEGASEASDQLRRVGRGVKDVGTDAEVADAKFAGFMDTVRGGVKGAVGLVGGFGLALGLKDVVSQGLALQTQQSALQQTLQRTGHAGKGAYDEIMAASEKLSTSGGFSTEENLQAMNAFMHETGSVSESMKALSAATDIARAKHESLAAALGTVRSAMAGNYRGVRQLVKGFVPITSSVDALDKRLKVNIGGWDQQAQAMNKSAAGSGTAWLRQMEISHGVTNQMRQQAEEQDRVASGQKALGLITGQYSGQMSKFAHTTQGRLDATRAAFKNLGANIGEALLPAVKVAAIAMGGFASFLDKDRWAAYALMGVVTALGVDAMGGKLVKGAKDAGKAVKGVGSIAGWVAKQLGLMSAAQDGEVASATEAGAATDVATGQMVLFDAATTEGAAATSALDVALGLLLSPILAVVVGVAALGVGIYELVAHFGTVKRVALGVWHGIESGVKVAASAIKTAFTAAFNWLKGAFKDVIHFLEHDTPQGGIFSMIKDFAGGHFGAGLGALVHGATFGLLNSGGTVTAHNRVKHLYTGGPAGTDTVQGWLTPGEDVLSRAGAATLNGMIGQSGLSMLNAGGNPFRHMLASELSGMQITASPVVLRLNDRVLAEGVVRYALNRAARGPSSLVGGPQVTGFAAG